MKRGQTAIIGFIVTMVLIIVVISLFYSQFVSLFTGDSEYTEIKASSEHIADLLLSEGHPGNWDWESVKKVGLLDGDSLSLKKLEAFAEINYSRSKLLLGTKYDYLFFVEVGGEKLNVSGREFLGWNGYFFDGNGAAWFRAFFGIIQEKAEHIAKNEKFVFLENKSGGESYARLVVYTWDAIDFRLGSTECSDGRDNDGNGYCDTPGATCDPGVDAGDPGCDYIFDDYESTPLFEDSFQCRITADSDCYYNETEIMQLSTPFSPFNLSGQFHSLVGGDYRVCCYYVNYISTDCNQDDSITVLDVGDSHVEQGNFVNYDNDVCLYGPYKNISCRCSYAGEIQESCLFSISDKTNAHIKGCDDGFDINITCGYSDAGASFTCP